MVMSTESSILKNIHPNATASKPEFLQMAGSGHAWETTLKGKKFA